MTTNTFSLQQPDKGYYLQLQLSTLTLAWRLPIRYRP